MGEFGQIGIGNGNCCPLITLFSKHRTMALKIANDGEGDGVAMNHTGQGESPATPEEYMAALPEDRAEQIGQLRQLILQHLPRGYVERMDFGMIAYVIPLETYPETYNGHPLMYAALASQKRHMSLYLMNVYGDDESQRWFADGFAAAGKKLDMGKACVRFRKLDDLPLDLIGEAIARTPVDQYISSYEASRAQMAENRKTRRQ